MGKENSQTFSLLVFIYFLSVENILCRDKNRSVASVIDYCIGDEFCRAVCAVSWATGEMAFVQT